MKSITNYKFQIVNFLKHPLFSGTAVMILGSNFANFLAFVYHLIIGRMLGPANYGDLAAAISLSTEFSAIVGFLGMVITKFVSSATDKKLLRETLSWFFQKSLILASLFGLVFLIFSPIFSNFFHLKASIVILIPIYLFFAILTMVLRSFLQGTLKFIQLTISSNIELILRLVFGIIFVYWGFSTFGAVLGIAIAGFLGFGLTLLFTGKFSLFGGSHKLDTKKIVLYSFPIFIFTLTSTSFLTSDTLLAKHFINSHDAGIYASLSNLGKIVLYGTAPVGAVMFPLISQRYAAGINYLKIFYLSMLLVVGISIVILSVYLLFPDIAIKILYGDKFLEGSPYLIWFGLFSAVYSISGLIISYYLSIGKVRVVALPVIFSILQILGLLLFNNSILTMVGVSLATATLLLLSLVIYFGYERGKIFVSSNSRL